MAAGRLLVDSLPLARQLLAGGPADLLAHVVAAGDASLAGLIGTLTAQEAPRAGLLADLVRLEHHLQGSLPGSGTTSWDLPRVLAAPATPLRLLHLAHPISWTLHPERGLVFEGGQGLDDALVLSPDWVACLDSRRMNAYHRYGTLHLALGDVAWEIDRLHTELLRRGGPDQPVDPQGDEATYFTRDGDDFRLRDRWYFTPTPSILDEDLALLLRQRRGDKAVRLRIGADGLAFAGVLLSALCRSRPMRALREQLDDRQWSLVAQLVREGALLAVPRTAPPAPDYTARLVAHSAVLLASPTHRVLVDPLLVVRDRPDFDPTEVLEEPLDAVLITHSHWDHFTLDGLLRIDRGTTVLLPAHQHPDSIVNLDMARVCRELGFRDVVELAPWQSHQVGDITMTAVPYFGEGFGPECPRDWMTFHARLGGRTVLGLVDACRDDFGDMDEVVPELTRRLGTVDVLFAPASGFSYPRSHYTRRPFRFTQDQDLFTGGPDDVVRWAAQCGAGKVVPYALFHTGPQDLDHDSEAAEADRFRSGSIAGLEARMATAPEGPLVPLRPGEALTWTEGAMPGRAAVV
jgi:L-ascorbate metabolism protein UlaG (beta-lactamase superfamily)